MDVKKLIKGSLFTAIASFVSADATAQGFTSKKIEMTGLENDAVDILVGQIGSNKIYKNVLKIKRNGDLNEIAGHRSHSSHRSSSGGSYSSTRSTRRTIRNNHSSHSSHSSSSYSVAGGSRGSSTTTTRTTTTITPTRTTTKAKKSSSFYDNTQTKKEYSLGDRDLTYYSAALMSGDDVAELIALLQTAGYLPNEYQIVWMDGKAQYTKDVADAVRRFQTDNMLPATGTANKATIDKLKSKVSQ